MTKDLGKTLFFVLAAALGTALAFGFYAALKPSVEVIVQPIERQQQHLADSLARRRATKLQQQQRAAAAARATPPATPTQVAAQPQASPATADQAALARPTRPAGSATQLPLTPAATRETGGRLGLLSLVLSGALAAAWALWEARQRLQLPVPTSRVLEALLTLKPHQELLKKCLSPRQIKRFNSKARVQHRQLTALAQHNAGFLFPVEGQLLVFQALLLLEEDREGAHRLPNASQSEFIAHLEQAYTTRADLAAARKLAHEAQDIAAALAREAPTLAALTPAQHHQLLAQLHELNAGLLD